MEKIILKFRTASEVYEFEALTKAVHSEIDPVNCTLISECGDAEIELAVNAFDAVQIQRLSSQKQDTP